MPVLTTWGDYSSYVDAAGKYRVIWQWEDGGIEFIKFDIFKTTAELDIFFASLKFDRDYSGYITVVQYFTEDEETIRQAVAYIRPRPTLTLSQWNTYLNTLTYEKRAIIKAFLHKLAIGLAAHYGVVLANYTETEILAKTRNWICSVNINILKRVCFGHLITL